MQSMEILLYLIIVLGARKTSHDVFGSTEDCRHLNKNALL